VEGGVLADSGPNELSRGHDAVLSGRNSCDYPVGGVEFFVHITKKAPQPRISPLKASAGASDFAPRLSKKTASVLKAGFLPI
jgi:hypothetical protein